MSDNHYAQSYGSSVRHLIAEVRGANVITLCGIELHDPDRVDETAGELCENCTRKAT